MARKKQSAENTVKNIRRSPEEKLEIIQIVELSELPIKKTLEELDVPRSSFYRWYLALPGAWSGRAAGAASPGLAAVSYDGGNGRAGDIGKGLEILWAGAGAGAPVSTVYSV